MKPMEKIQERLEQGWILYGIRYVSPGFPPCTAFGLREDDHVESELEVGCDSAYSALSGIEEHLGGSNFKILPVFRRIDRWMSMHPGNEIDARVIEDRVVVIAAGTWRMAVKHVREGGSRAYQPRVIREGVGQTLLQALTDLFVITRPGERP